MIYSTWSGRLKWKWWKNASDLKALLFRWYPEFVYRDVDDLGGHVPVFTFHEVEPESFELCCRHLAEGGYRTLHPDEYLGIVEGRYRAPKRSVLLTFDDGGGSLWAVAYPLLKKYGLQGTAFVVTGLVPEHDRDRPTLAEVWEGQADREDVTGREHGDQRFCTWEELATMQNEDVVSVQSHTHWHALVPVSDRVMDFINPKTDPYHLGNFNVPVLVQEAADPHERPDRSLVLGRPVFESLPFMAGKTRHFPHKRLVDECASFAVARGRKSFFEETDWRRQLFDVVRKYRSRFSQCSSRETQSQYEGALGDALVLSRDILQTRLGVEARHLCYPWYHGCALSDRLSSGVGFKITYYRTDASLRSIADQESNGQAVRVPRIDAHYLRRLPGPLRSPLPELVLSKFRRAS